MNRNKKYINNINRIIKRIKKSINKIERIKQAILDSTKGSKQSQKLL